MSRCKITVDEKSVLGGQVYYEAYLDTDGSYTVNGTGFLGDYDYFVDCYKDVKSHEHVIEEFDKFFQITR